MGPSYNELKEWALTQESISEEGLMAYFEMGQMASEDMIKSLQIRHVVSIFRESGSFRVIQEKKRLAEVCSLSGLYGELKEMDDKTAIVSFSDYPTAITRIPSSIPTFRIALMDYSFEQIHVDAESWFREGRSLAYFIKEKREKGYRFLCQCECGVSRSAAVAAAILEYYEGKGIDIFSDFRYHPNKMIYLTLLKDLREKGI